MCAVTKLIDLFPKRSLFGQTRSPFDFKGDWALSKEYNISNAASLVTV